MKPLPVMSSHSKLGSIKPLPVMPSREASNFRFVDPYFFVILGTCFTGFGEGPAGGGSYSGANVTLHDWDSESGD